MTLSNLSSSNLRQSFQSAVIGSTTGTVSTGTFTDSNGFSWAYYSFTTGSGSISVSISGYADLLVVGGGAGGSTGGTYSSGGGAGQVSYGIFWLPVGTYTTTVGAGGAANANTGNDSSLGSILIGARGQRGAASQTSADVGSTWYTGGGGGTGGISINAMGSGYPGQGAGGTVRGANVYSGISLNYTNASVEYGRGGFNGGGAGAANTGNGGYGNTSGGSGIVVVKVRTN